MRRIVLRPGREPAVSVVRPDAPELTRTLAELASAGDVRAVIVVGRDDAKIEYQLEDT